MSAPDDAPLKDPGAGADVEPAMSASARVRPARVRKPLEPLLHQVEIIAACERVVDVALEHADVVETRDCAWDQLPMLLAATEEALEIEGRAYAAAAARLAAHDAFLSRRVRRLADELAAGAEAAGAARAEAVELLEAGELNE